MKTLIKIFVGFILFISSFVLLAWNEGNNAKNLATAMYMEKKAVQTEAVNIKPENDGKLVAITGPAVTEDTIFDENIGMPATLVLDRTVQMYQWDEKEGTGSDGNSVYEYTKTWSETKINSDSFHDNKYKNPDFPIRSANFYATTAKLGDYDLSVEQIERIAPETELTDLPENDVYSVINGKYFSGKNMQEPEIGDILISYSYAPSGTDISMIGIQQTNRINPFSYKGRTNYVQYNGSMSKDAVIEQYRHENMFLTMSLRVLGWLLMFVGLKLLISPANDILEFVPFFGKIANAVSTMVLMLISLLLTVITIAIAWFIYRPVLSLVIILISLYIAKQIKKSIPQRV